MNRHLLSHFQNIHPNPKILFSILSYLSPPSSSSSPPFFFVPWKSAHVLFMCERRVHDRLLMNMMTGKRVDFDSKFRQINVKFQFKPKEGSVSARVRVRLGSMASFKQQIPEGRFWWVWKNRPWPHRECQSEDAVEGAENGV